MQVMHIYIYLSYIDVSICVPNGYIYIMRAARCISSCAVDFFPP